MVEAQPSSVEYPSGAAARTGCRPSRRRRPDGTLSSSQTRTAQRCATALQQAPACPEHAGNRVVTDFLARPRWGMGFLYMMRTVGISCGPHRTRNYSMTELLYYQDAYLQEFDAVVTACDTDRRCAALDRTAFYPGGGGQRRRLAAMR